MSLNKEVSELSTLFVAHRMQLFRAALKILGNQESAEDVVQDAYLKVAEAASIFDIKQPLAYLFQVVRNLAIDRHRRFALEKSFFEGEEEKREHVPAPSGTPEMIAISQQHLTLIAQALSELPERTRHVFELHRLGGLTQREIAAKIGVSTTLVNFLIRDAITHCRTAVRHM